MSLFELLTPFLRRSHATHEEGLVPKSQKSFEPLHDYCIRDQPTGGLCEQQSPNSKRIFEAWLENYDKSPAGLEPPDVRDLLSDSELNKVNVEILRDTISHLRSSPNFANDIRPLALLMLRAKAFDEVLCEGKPVDGSVLKRLCFGSGKSIGPTLANSILPRKGPQAFLELLDHYTALSKRYRCLMMLELCKRTARNGLPHPQSCQVIVQPETCCQRAFELHASMFPFDEFPMLPLGGCDAKMCGCTIRVARD